MKNTLLSMMRSAWALNPEWVSANLATISRFMKGDNTGEVFGIREEIQAATLMYSPLYRVSCYTDLSKLPKGSTAFIDVVGVITKYGGMCSYGAAEFAELVEDISASDNISNIIFHFDTPGGQVAGTQLFADAIKACPKRTIAFINDGYCCSAGAWVASACDEIYCSKDTDEIGSIGVYCSLQDFKAYFIKQGLPVYEVYADQSTEKNHDSRELFDKGNDKPLKADLNVLAAKFISTIKANRGDKLKGDAWQTGRMFFAPDALKIGLIDGIKNLAEITAMLDAQEVEESEDETDKDTTVTVEIDADDSDQEDNNNLQPESQNQKTMFGSKNKFPALTALSGKKADELSEDEVTAANAEMHAAGIDADVVLGRASLHSAADTRISELEGQLAAEQKKPGALFQTAPPTMQDDKAEDAEAAEVQKMIDNLAHNKTADELL